MKKIYLLLATLTVSMASQAQLTKQGTLGAVSNVDFIPTLSSAKTAVAMPGDTAGWDNYVDFLPEFGAGGGQPTLWGEGDGGYIFGRNTILSTCAQGYFNVNSTPISIEKVVMWVGAKDMAATPSPTSNVLVSIWSMANNKARTYVPPVPPATQGTFTLDSYGPNLKVGSTATVNITNVNASNGLAWTVATFPTPISISADFAVVANSWGLAATDTIGFVTDAVGAAAGINMAFMATAGNSWYKADGGVYPTGSLDNNIAMFAVLGVTSGVKEFVNGVKLSAIYPNPTKDVATISYSLEKASNNVSLEVLDIRGQKVYSETFGTQQAGDYKINLDASSYAAGSYFYQLRSNGNVLTKEFVVTK